jgi:hypothetical protein
MNFVPLLLVHLCNTACYVDDRRVVASQPRDSMLTAGLSSPAAPNLASIKGVSHEFCTPAASSLCNTLPALAMLMIALWRHSRETSC